MGYVAEVVDPNDLLEKAIEEARRYLKGADSSHRLTKRLLYEGLTTSVVSHQIKSRQTLLECFASEEHQEGVAAFIEGRTPNFGKPPRS